MLRRGNLPDIVLNLRDRIIADAIILPRSPGQENPELTGHNRGLRDLPEPRDLAAEPDGKFS